MSGQGAGFRGQDSGFRGQDSRNKDQGVRKMEKICKNCEFYRRYVCQVPLYEEGHYVGSRPVKETDRCSLFEPVKEGEK